MAFISYTVGYKGQDMWAEPTFDEALEIVKKFYVVDTIDYLDEDNANLIVKDRENGNLCFMTIRQQEEDYDIFS